MIDLARLFSRSKPAPAPSASFGYAVVGLGRIAEHFLRGIADSPTVRAAALVSGDSKKAQKHAQIFHVPFTCDYDGFESLEDREDVQAVYLALPVSMHREYTARAAAMGKHVLVEKPMASDVAECKAMIADCKTAGVLLSVAYRCPFDPMHRKLREFIQREMLGTIERIESEFGFPLAADDWRFNAALAGGGSAYDVGVYPLNAARYLMGTEPEIETATATTNAAGMETSIDWTMRFPNGVKSACKSSYVKRLGGRLRVRGTAGELMLDPAFTHREPVRMHGWYADPASGKRIEIDDSDPPFTPSHFRLEAEHLAECVRTGQQPITSGEDGLRDMEMIRDMYAKAGLS